MTQRERRSMIVRLSGLLENIEADVDQMREDIEEAMGEISGVDNDTTREDADDAIDAIDDVAVYARGVARQCASAVKQMRAIRKTLKTDKQWQEENQILHRVALGG